MVVGVFVCVCGMECMVDLSTRTGLGGRSPSPLFLLLFSHHVPP